MGQTADNRRTDGRHAMELKLEIYEKQIAYNKAEEEFQQQLERLLRRADRVVLLAKVSQKDGV